MRSIFPKVCFLIFLIAFGAASAQKNPLIGTWEMVSVSGIDADGEKFYQDSTTIRETKIITPTHYMLIAHDVVSDSLVFNRSYAGTVQFKGNKYIEVPMMSSLQIVENLKTDFTWSVDGDTFIQSGHIVRPDGRKVTLEKLVFKRVKTSKAYPQNPAIGTLNYISSTYTTPEGETHVEKAPQIKVMEIITPTHWMGISYKDNKFENAMGGAYRYDNGVMYPSIDHSALTTRKPKSVELKVSADKSKVIFKGTATSWNGKTSTWEDVCERIK